MSHTIGRRPGSGSHMESPATKAEEAKVSMMSGPRELCDLDEIEKVLLSVHMGYWRRLRKAHDGTGCEALCPMCSAIEGLGRSLAAHVVHDSERENPVHEELREAAGAL